MDYQVWKQEEYSNTWSKVDCGDLPAVRREVDKAVRAGGEPLVTIEVPYELTIKIGEPGAEKPKPRKEKEKPEDKIEEAPKHEPDQAAAGSD